MSGRQRRVLVVLAFVLAFGRSATAQAQQAEWQFTAAPYFLAPHMSGTASVHGTTVEVDASPTDIFDKLQFGFMIYLEARRGDWAFSADVLYMDLSQDAERLPLELGMDQTAVSLSVYRRISDQLEAYGGGRFNDIGASLATTGDRRTLVVDAAETWFDPYIGLRFVTAPSPRLSFEITGDLGGFGVGSDLAWQFAPKLRYGLAESVELGLAYRWLSMDYEAGGSGDNFVYDVTTSGPQLGVAFTF